MTSGNTSIARRESTGLKGKRMCMELSPDGSRIIFGDGEDGPGKFATRQHPLRFESRPLSVRLLRTVGVVSDRAYFPNGIAQKYLGSIDCPESDLTNAQLPMLNSHPKGKMAAPVRAVLVLPRMRIDNWELSIGQIHPSLIAPSYF